MYDVSSWRSFEQLKTFLDDARALAEAEPQILGMLEVVGDPPLEHLAARHP